MKPWRRWLTVVVVLAAAALGQTTLAPARRAQRPAARRSRPPAAVVHAANAERGQQVFVRNCARCHAAPEGFPASIAGTIALHMRVRANLSQNDYNALLRFLKP